MQRRAFPVVIATLWAMLATSAVAQQAESPRFPEQGIAILDCAANAPVPRETCLLRVPPEHQMLGLRSDPLGATKGEFQLVKPGSARFPQDVSLTATLLLIDLSPGPNSGRRATFATEKLMITELVKRLPTLGPLAIYGFNENLTVLADFNTSRDVALETIQNLTLGGSNTRIATFVNDSISVLGRRDSALMRNLIVVTDGEEEGLAGLNDVVQNAVDQGVVVSAVGSFWRGAGAPENAAGMDYLGALSRGTSGAMAQIQLGNRADAIQRAGNLVSTLDAAWSASGLIIPVGPPQASTISMTLNEPILGQAGQFRETPVTATFRPVAAAAAEPPATEPVADPVAQQAMLFGFPAVYVYVAAGVLAALLILIIVLALRRKDAPEPVPMMPDVIDDPAPMPGPAMPGTDGYNQDRTQAIRPTVKPTAYLMFEDGRRRAGIGGEKISVGRSASNDVVIDAEGISRLHAQIYRNRDGGYSIADMDSLNGTFVNDTKITGTQKVQMGDKITFGKITVKLIPA